MNRVAEVDYLSSSLGTPSRTRLRAAVLPQGAGCLSRAAELARGEAVRESALRWPAFLLALEATELRLAGSVALTTPCRFTSAGESWGAFSAIIYPEGERLELTFETPRQASGCRADVSAELRVDRRAGTSLSLAAARTLRELRAQLQAHLGLVVWLAGT